jgi:predicted DsbA family dithiol-disulfide isomerase
MESLPVTYWSDPLCIWAFVAQQKLDSVVAEFGERIAITYRVVPVFGSVGWRFAEGPWSKGGVEARVAATAKVAAQHGHTDVTGAVWADDTPSSSWSPGAAIKAVFAMVDAGAITAAQAAAYQWQLRRRFFVDNVNITRRGEQVALASKLEIPIDDLELRLDDGSAVAALWEDNRLREATMIAGSPTWVFDGGRAKLYGNFDFGVLRATIEQLLCGLDPGCTDC